MPSRSSGRRPGKRLESSRDISCGNEMKFYLSAVITSLCLYFAGSEAAVRYLEWVRSRISVTVSNPSPPATSPPPVCPQLQAALIRQAQQQAQIHLRQALVSGDRQIVAYHPDPHERQKASARLQQMGEPPPPIVIGRDLAALQKP